VSDSEIGLETVGDSNELSEVVAIDCYIEPQMLPDGKFECPICYGAVESFPDVVSCQNHRACSDCWREYLRIQITESRVNLTCFQCSKPLHPNGMLFKLQFLENLDFKIEIQLII